MHQSQRRNVTRSYIFSQNESYVKTMMNSDFAFIRHSTIETYTSHTILSTRSRTNSHKWNTLRVEKEYSYCLEWFLLCHDFSTNLFFFSLLVFTTCVDSIWYDIVLFDCYSILSLCFELVSILLFFAVINCVHVYWHRTSQFGKCGKKDQKRVNICEFVQFCSRPRDIRRRRE